MREVIDRGSRLSVWARGALWGAVLLAALPASAWAADVTLTGDTTWDSDQSIDGTLTLDSNVVLTIADGADVSATALVMSPGARVVVQGEGSVLTMSDGATLGQDAAVEASGRVTLRLRGGSWELAGTSARISGNADIDVSALTVCASCSVDASGRGELQGLGSGAGAQGANGGAGAGHGGAGRAGAGQTVGGAFYGDPLGPVSAGSGGGRGANGAAPGGSGGGVVKIVASRLTLNGVVQANGGAGGVFGGFGGGGGAGGSIWVSVELLEGAGRLLANGGAGGPAPVGSKGGGGGGGHVYARYMTATPRMGQSAFVRVNSGVEGGDGHNGRAEQGTLGFYDEGSDDLYLVDGWRWLTRVAPYEYDVITTERSAAGVSEPALVRDDAALMGVLSITATRVVMADQGVWSLRAPEARLTLSQLQLSGGAVLGSQRVLLLEASGASTLGGASRVEGGERLQLGGGGAWGLSGASVLRSPDLYLEEVGDVTLNAGHLEGNVRGEAPNLTVSSASTVSADGYGYTRADRGPGGGRNSTRGGSGGSHGGLGNQGSNNLFVTQPYGSAYEPVTAGSAGGDGGDPGGGDVHGGAGGGVIRLTVSGALTLEGVIRANGRDGASGGSYAGGGGGGGSVWLTVGSVSGAGRFEATGGDGPAVTFPGGGGGGGRVAVYYTSSTLSAPQGSSVAGGSGYEAGGVGTMALVAQGNPGREDDALTVYGGWRWQSNDGDHAHASFMAYDGAVVEGPDSVGQVMRFSGAYALGAGATWSPSGYDVTLEAASVTLGAGAKVQGGARSVTLELGSALTLGTGAEINAGSLSVEGAALDVTIGGNGGLTAGVIALDVRDLTLASSSSRLSASGLGSLAEVGAGAGLRGNAGAGGGGASHGGVGGRGFNNDGVRAWHGSALEPTSAGSGGGHGDAGVAPGGRGGGVIRVQVSRALVTEGVMSADGGDGAQQGEVSGGGGAGGSIWVTTASLAGGGDFFARGGSTNTQAARYGGGGGGGRVVVYYASGGVTRPQDSQVSGGVGSTDGAVGTLAFVADGGTPEDQSDDEIRVYGGWRFQANDAPYAASAFVAGEGAVVSGPTAANLGLEFSDLFELKAAARWYPNEFATQLVTEDFVLRAQAIVDSRSDRNHRLNGPALGLLINGDGLLESDVELVSAALTVTGTSVVTLMPTAEVISGNVQWFGEGLTVSSGALLDVSGRGAGADQGTGRGQGGAQAGSGGGHGGRGGEGVGQGVVGGWYGSSTRPATAGSGGGTGNGGAAAGGWGGGVIRVRLTGALVLNGQMLAHGERGAGVGGVSGGGGAGGSIWVTTTSLAGVGSFRAQGGAADAVATRGGGGGGGRIFVEYNAASSFSNRQLSSVVGGVGAGSVVGESGTLAFLDKTNMDLFIVEGWRWQQSDTIPELRHVSVVGSTTDSSALVRDDNNTQNLVIDGTLTLGADSEWALTGATDLSVSGLVLTGGQFGGGALLRVTASDAIVMSGAARMAGSQVHLRGGASLSLTGNAQIISNDLFLDEMGPVDLRDTSALRGNVRGTVETLNLAQGTTIYADGYGFAAESGEGAGYRSAGGGSGGGHGNVGGPGHSQAQVRGYYGSAYAPVTKGSGGGNGGDGQNVQAQGGAGGGVVNLLVEGAANISGVVSASGAPGARAGAFGGGGGAGGSIYLRVLSLSGSGALLANGGDGASGTGVTAPGGRGAGGRVAVYYSSGGLTTPSGSGVAQGGGFTSATTHQGTLAFVSRGTNPTSALDDVFVVYGGWRWQEGDGPHVHASFTAQDGAVVEGPDGEDEELRFTGTYLLKASSLWRANVEATELTATHFTMEDGAQVQGGEEMFSLSLTGNGTMSGAAQINVGVLVVSGTSNFTLSGAGQIRAGAVDWRGRNLSLAATGARIDASGRGELAGEGDGAGAAGLVGGGGGHGGQGGLGAGSNAAPGAWYGSSTRPATAGSGGGAGGNGAAQGGRGGGAVRVELDGELNLVGAIHADGAPGVSAGAHSGGGGAGGSIWVKVGTLKNLGALRARGGASALDGGGGGGGRVYVEYTQLLNAAPSNSTVAGGASGTGTGGEVGTLAFYRRGVQDLAVYEGWRWQLADQPFLYRNVRVSESATLPTAWVRDDEEALRLDLSGTLTMDEGALWTLTASLTDLRALGFVMTDAEMSGQEALSLQIGAASILDEGALVSSPDLRLAGAGRWDVKGGSRVRSAAMLFENAGVVTLESGILEGNLSGSVAGLSLVDAAAMIDARGYGFGPELGPGAGSRSDNGGSGGSHGGVGGGGNGQATVRAWYGSAVAPVTRGSGGGNGRGQVLSALALGGAGGGAVELVVNGQFLWNGTINVSGRGGQQADVHSGGGGAGGSVLVRARTLRKQAEGRVHAQGGSSVDTSFDGGGGAGGRVLIAYDQAVELVNPGLVFVNGGTGHQGGQPGTAAYLDVDDEHLMPYGAWRWEQAWQPASYRQLTIAPSTAVSAEGTAVEVLVSGACQLGAGASWVQTGTDLRMDCARLLLEDSASIDANGRVVLLGVQDELTLSEDAWMRAQALYQFGGEAAVELASGADLFGNLTLYGDSLTMASGSRLSATGFGYAAEDGPGAGVRSQGGGSGGGHGGAGGAGANQSTVGAAYGDAQRPATAGSGGGDGRSLLSPRASGGAGGGTIRLQFLGLAQVDGLIEANGEAGARVVDHSGGGGAGGSIWVDADTLEGSGTIRANGGAAVSATFTGGGGGGGRISACALTFEDFSGSLAAAGGASSAGAGAQGTVQSPNGECDLELPEGGVLLGKGLSSPSGGVYLPGTANVPVLQLRLREATDANDVQINSLTFTGDGSGNEASHLGSVRLYRDLNRDGLVSQGEALLGTRTYSADNGAVTFTNLGTIPAGGELTLLLTYDFQPGAPNDVTFRARVAGNDAGVLVVAGEGVGVPMYGAPLWGSSFRVSATPPPIVTQLNPPSTLRGAPRAVTVSGYHFTGATRVTLSDPSRTELAIVSVYDDGQRMGVIVPEDAPIGSWHVLVTTPVGTNTSSATQLSVRESCSTGYQGACAVGERRIIYVNGSPTATAAATTFSMRPTPPTQAFLGDDQYTSPISTGFDFQFFGQTANSIRISSNGVVMVEPQSSPSTSYSPTLVPSPSVPNGMVAGYWVDLNPNRSGSGKIYYGTQGSAPNREFVVMFDGVLHYSGSGAVTMQFIFKENSNQIELMCASCISNGNNHTQGIESPSGTVGAARPGRAQTSFSLTNDGTVFTTGQTDGDPLLICDPDFEPGDADEICGNSVDEDCDGVDLSCEYVDNDGDGYSPADGDCDDDDDAVFPEDGVGCAAGGDALRVTGNVRAVEVYSPLGDKGSVGWTENLDASWLQQSAEALVDGALRLQEEGDYAEIAASVYTAPTGEDLTVGAWVYAREAPGEEGVLTVLARGGFGAESYGIFYDQEAETWRGLLRTSGGLVTVSAPGQPLEGQQWTHVALTYDGEQVRLLINGAVRGSTSASGDIDYAGDSPVRVGGGHGTNLSWPGRIDEVMFFGRAVSAAQLQAMIRANLRHDVYYWGLQGPLAVFGYDFDADESRGLASGSFHGEARPSDRGSLRKFPTFASIVVTSDGFEIWDEPSGRLWARYWLSSRIEGGTALELERIDHVAAAAGRIYLGSADEGMVVFDYVNDRIERWTTEGISVWSGRIGVANQRGERVYSAPDGDGLRLRSDEILGLSAWTRPGRPQSVPYVGVSSPEGVWVVAGGYDPEERLPAPFVSSAYLASDDVYTSQAQAAAEELEGGAIWRVGERIYYTLRHVGDHSRDIVSTGLFGADEFEDPSDNQLYELDAETPVAVMNRTNAPSLSPINYGVSGNPVWGDVLTTTLSWGGARDVVVFEGMSRHEGAGPEDHLVVVATPSGVVLLDQGPDGPEISTLSGFTEATALCIRGTELFVGTQNSGLSRLVYNPDDGGFFMLLETYTTESDVRLPSDHVTALSCGKNALVATTEGAVSIRFPELEECDTELAGACAYGAEYLVDNEPTCVQVVFPSGELCDDEDNDCDGLIDELPDGFELPEGREIEIIFLLGDQIGDDGVKPEVGICDYVGPIFEPIPDVTVTTDECVGVVVALPEPIVHSPWDEEPTVTNDAPPLFEFGTTTVYWEAETENPCTPEICDGPFLDVQILSERVLTPDQRFYLFNVCNYYGLCDGGFDEGGCFEVHCTDEVCGSETSDGFFCNNAGECEEEVVDVVVTCSPRVCNDEEHPWNFACNVREACYCDQEICPLSACFNEGDPDYGFCHENLYCPPVLEDGEIFTFLCTEDVCDRNTPASDFCWDAGICDQEVIEDELVECTANICLYGDHQWADACQNYGCFNVCSFETCEDPESENFLICVEQGYCYRDADCWLGCGDPEHPDYSYCWLVDGYCGPIECQEACGDPEHPDYEFCWDEEEACYGIECPYACGDSEHRSFDRCWDPDVYPEWGPWCGPVECGGNTCFDPESEFYDGCWDDWWCPDIHCGQACLDDEHPLYAQCVDYEYCGDFNICDEACLDPEHPDWGLCQELGLCGLNLCGLEACAFPGHPDYGFCHETGQCDRFNDPTSLLTAMESSEVTVVYDGAPELEAPPDLVVEAVSPSGTVVALGDALASICISGGVTVTHDGPLRFPLGSTTVTWTARGQQGRPTTDTQVVTVVDTTPPTIEVGPDIVVDRVEDIVLPTPIVSDNATPTELIVVTHDAPQLWGVREWITVTFTAVDLAGNRATDSMRVFVRDLNSGNPTLVIVQPENGVWVPPPATVLARFMDPDCEEDPTVTSNNLELGLTVARAGEGWDITTTRVSDGVHNFSLTGVSGCTGRSATASRVFGVDSAAPVPRLLTTIPQVGVDVNEPLSWRPISRLKQLDLSMIMEDSVSGLAEIRVELFDQEQQSGVVLHEETFSARLPGRIPEQGSPLRPIVGCSHQTLCINGKLQMRLLDRRYYDVRLITTDVAGNVQTFHNYVQAVNLRQAIELWDRAVRLTESESEEAAELLGQISVNKLQPAIVSYDYAFYGNIWLAMEDSIGLLRVATLQDDSLDYDFYLELIGELGIDFQRFRLEQTILERGGTNLYFDRSEEEIDTAQDHLSVEAWQDVFTSLGNAWFWQFVGLYEMRVDSFSVNPYAGYEDSVDVMTVLRTQMQEYVEASEDLPGRAEIQDVLELLAPVFVYLQDVVRQGDLAQTDFEHVDALMRIGEAAVRLQRAEETIVWVRNWRWGLAGIVSLYAERALFSASTWIGRSSPVWMEGEDRYSQAEIYRLDYRPDSYMETLIDSRCDIIGVYNGIYEPDYEVPLECCARVREFHDMDSEYRGAPSEIPIPDQCRETITVELTETGFSPSSIRLSVGQGVKFINRTQMAQNIVAGAPGDPDLDTLDSGELEPNGVYEVSFDAAVMFMFFSATQPELPAGSVVVRGN